MQGQFYLISHGNFEQLTAIQFGDASQAKLSLRYSFKGVPHSCISNGLL